MLLVNFIWLSIVYYCNVLLLSEGLVGFVLLVLSLGFVFCFVVSLVCFVLEI